MKNILLALRMKQWMLLSLVLYCEMMPAQTLLPGQDQAGIDHVYKQRLFNGGGVAFFDSDNDGDDDVYITGGEAVDHFYINNGDGTFSYESPFAGFNITSSIYTTSVNAGDINGDGFNDLYVTTIFDANFDFYRNLLFINQGDNTFREVWDQTSPLDKAWSMGAVLLDHDLDGDLDIYTINYIRESNLVRNEMNEVVGYAHTCYPNRFYENRGNLEFREKSRELGLDDEGCGLAVIATDYDLDRDPDLYLANDFGDFVAPNKMFRNDVAANGHFVEESKALHTDVSMYGMGIAKGDVNGDAVDDLYITNFGRNVLLVRDDTVYTDRTTEAGVENTYNVGDTSFAVSWGTNLLDIDNDGDLDLYVANGYAPTSAILPSEFPDADQLYFNDGRGHFTIDTTAFPASNRYASRGTAFSDIDDDGDLDIFTVVFDRPSLGLNPQSPLYINQGNSNHWLKIRLEGKRSNFNAFGARILLHLGNAVLQREVHGGASHCSQNSQVAHFGLGEAGLVDSLLIYWPGMNEAQRLYEIRADQTLYVVEDSLTTATQNIDLSRVAVHPNPASSFLYLSLDDSQGTGTTFHYQVVGSKGDVLLSGTHASSPKFAVDVSGLAPGHYTLIIKSDSNRYLARFVKGQ